MREVTPWFQLQSMYSGTVEYNQLNVTGLWQLIGSLAVGSQIPLYYNGLVQCYPEPSLRLISSNRNVVAQESKTTQKQVGD